MQSMALRFAGSNNTVDSSGAFMGFDDLSDDSDISDVEKGSKEPLDEVNENTCTYNSPTFFLMSQFFLETTT